MSSCCNAREDSGARFSELIAMNCSCLLVAVEINPFFFLDFDWHLCFCGAPLLIVFGTVALLVSSFL
jgi:hypothetical protein